MSILHYNKTGSEYRGSDISDLTPLRSMPPYEPCWCGSGAKWKFCHKVRESERPLSFGEVYANMLAEARKGYCSYPGAPNGCSGRIIKSHTVQRGGGLIAIAQDGHVLSPKEGIKNLQKNNGLMIPERIGINNASTFMGFCDQHDNEMFKPIEHGEVAMDDRAAFLLAFRSVAYEGFNKITAKRWLEYSKADAGMPFEKQAQYQMIRQWHLIGTNAAIKDFEAWKKLYDQAFLLADFSDIWYYGIVFDQLLPIAACGALMPEFDFSGQRLQFIGENVDTLEHVSINITAIGNKTLAMFGWQGAGNNMAAKFVKSYAAISDNEKANALLRLCFEHIENCFITPGWWLSLESSVKDLLVQRIKNGTIAGERKPDCLRDDGIQCFTEVCIDKVYERLPC